MNERYEKKFGLLGHAILTGRLLSFGETLPPKQREIKTRAEGAALLTFTFNRHVKAFTKTDDGEIESVMLRSLKVVDDILNILKQEKNC